MNLTSPLTELWLNSVTLLNLTNLRRKSLRERASLVKSSTEDKAVKARKVNLKEVVNKVVEVARMDKVAVRDKKVRDNPLALTTPLLNNGHALMAYLLTSNKGPLVVKENLSVLMEKKFNLHRAVEVVKEAARVDVALVEEVVDSLSIENPEEMKVVALEAAPGPVKTAPTPPNLRKVGRKNKEERLDKVRRRVFSEWLIATEMKLSLLESSSSPSAKWILIKTMKSLLKSSV
jgi:hypothetical protein